MATTGPRKRLFKQYELSVRQGTESVGISGKLPVVPKNLNPGDIAFATPFEKANVISQRQKQGIGAPIKQSQDVQDKIEQMFNLIEKKTSEMVVSKSKSKNAIQATSIVSDSI